MAEEENKDDELVVVEVDEEGKLPEDVENKEPVEKVDAKAPDADADEHDEDDEDERLAASQDDSDAEISQASKNRKRRRAMQKRAREQQEAERAALLERNRMLEERLTRIEGVQVGQTVSTLDSRISKVEEDIRKAENIMVQAGEAGNSRDQVAAMRIRDEARDELKELQGIKKSVTAQTETQGKPEVKQQQVAEMAGEWARANATWFNPRGGDNASNVALQIDAQMTRDGVFDPGTRAYWVELTKRVNAQISDGQDDQDDDDKPAAKPGERRGPPLGSGKNGTPTVKKNEVYVTPARKAAMIEAGVWDDPVRRQAYLKSYQEYDSQHPASR